MRRVFLAINLPDEIKEQIALLQQPFDLKGIKLVEKDNLHFSLAFLGHINDQQLELLKNPLSNLIVQYSPLLIKCQGLGVFPDIERPQVIWMGGQSRQLNNLGQQLRAELKRAKLNYDEKKFSAHLTLGRVKFITEKNLSIIKQQLTRQDNNHFATIKVETVEIMESELTTHGPTYQVIASFKLLRKNV